MKPIIIALLLAGTAWGQQAAHPDPVPRGWALMQLPAPGMNNHVLAGPEAGPIGFARADYYEAHEAIVNVLDHAQLNNAEWENLYSLAHAVNNVYLFLGTSKATGTDAVKAKLELEALHIGEKLDKYHIPTHEEDMDELLRKMDGWGKKL